MATQHLFQLGMDLETGTTQTEDRTVSEETSSEKVVHLQSRLENEDRQDHFVRREGKVFAGTHLIIEVLGGTGLDEPDRIEAAFNDAIKACGATLLHMHLHRFTPQGVSGVAVLAESHISVHTWPEAGYGAFDVFMCGEADPWQAVPILRDAFEAKDVKVTELLRGEGIV